MKNELNDFNLESSRTTCTDLKNIRKEQIEHTKVIYEKNKEIYKYTFESMKFLDSKLTRAMNLITFMFTVQTGLISVVFLKMEANWERLLLLIFSMLGYALLIYLLSKSIEISTPQERSFLHTDSDYTVNELNEFSEDFSKTLQIYVNIANDFASVNKSLSNRNLLHANQLIHIHTVLLVTYALIGLEALTYVFSKI